MEYNIRKTDRIRACDSLPLGCCTADYPKNTVLKYRETETGFRVYKWPSLPRKKAQKEISDFEPSLIQSKRSRIRAGWTLGASQPGWSAMTTLTYGDPPGTFGEVRDHFVRWKDRARKEFGKSPHGWFLEFQKRGAPHFHVFWPLKIGIGENLQTESYIWRSRKGKKTKICNGITALYLSNAWCDIVGDKSKAFLDFQNGGITELFRCPDAAGRYVAKEGTKAAQKESPYPISRWWYLSPELHGKLSHGGEISLTEWEMKHGGICLSRVWPDDDWKSHGAKKGEKNL